MKKLLLSLVALISFGFASAETYTYTAAEITGLSATADLAEVYVKGGFKFTVNKNGGATAPAYNKAGEIRLYAKNTLQVEANGANITAITFNMSSQGLKRWADFTPNSGTTARDETAGTTSWAGSSANITFTVGDKAVYGTDGDTKAGQFDFTSVTFTTDGALTDYDPSEVPDEPAVLMAEYKLATALTSGKYALACNDTIMDAFEGTKTYGYLSGETVKVIDGEFTATGSTTFTFTEVAGQGYTIQDRDGRYLYMDSTFNSFNANAQLPAKGGYWTATLGENGQVTIVNVEKQKTMLYSTKYSSLGAYATATEGEHLLPTLYAWVKDVEGEVVEPTATSVTALSQLASLAKDTNISMDVDLTVVYSNGSYVYVYDGTNYGLVFKANLGLEAGQVIAKGWTGTIDIYQNLIEIKPTADALTTSGTAEVPTPAVVEADEASTMLTTANQNVYVQLNDIVFAEATPAADETDNTARNFTGDADGTTINFYQRFGVESVPAGTYNVVGFISVYKETVQVFPISITSTAGISAAEADNAPATYYSIQGVKVANPTAGQLYIRVQSGKATKVIF